MKNIFSKTISGFKNLNKKRKDFVSNNYYINNTKKIFRRLLWIFSILCFLIILVKGIYTTKDIYINKSIKENLIIFSTINKNDILIEKLTPYLNNLKLLNTSLRIEFVFINEVRQISEKISIYNEKENTTFVLIGKDLSFIEKVREKYKFMNLSSPYLLKMEKLRMIKKDKNVFEFLTENKDEKTYKASIILPFKKIKSSISVVLIESILDVVINF